MKARIAVTGGKGGTGKSTIATNIAVALALEGRSVTLADLDVEAPNDHILLGASLENEEPVKTMLPFIDYSKCIKCGVCAEVCDTGAIILTPAKLPYVIPRLCSGCRACYFACPTKAISEGARIVGYTYHTRVDVTGATLELVTGVLREGEEHSPPVVLAARRRAESVARDILLVDTAAGTANHVAIALEKSDVVVAVTEPTPLGLHDLEGILRLASELGLRRVWIVVNRWGIGSTEKMAPRIEELAARYGAEIKARIPYSREVIESYVKGKPLVVSNPESPVSKTLRSLASMLLEEVG